MQNLYNLLPQEVISGQPVYPQYIAAFAQHQPDQLDNEWLLGTIGSLT